MADIFRDGHVKLAAVILWRRADEENWREAPMTVVNPGLDRWAGGDRADREYAYVYTVEAWTDHYETWANELEKKLADGQTVTLELIEGRALVEDAATRAEGDDADLVDGAAGVLRQGRRLRRKRLLLAEDVRAAMSRWPDRS